MPQLSLIVLAMLVRVINYYRHNTEPHFWRGQHPLVSHIDLIGLLYVGYLITQTDSWSMYVYLLSAGFLFFTSMHYHWNRQSPVWRKLDHFGIWIFITFSPLPFIARPDLTVWVLGLTALIGCYVKFYCSLTRAVSNWCFFGLAVVLLLLFSVDPLLGETLKWQETTWLFVAGLACYSIQFYLFHKEVPKKQYREIQHWFILVGFHCHANAGLTLQ